MSTGDRRLLWQEALDLKVKVIAQYHWETSDHKHKLAGTDDKVVEITTFCQGFSTCPDALNRV
ncbi:hypothetical protein [Streptomyces sp. NPDC051014]|uniref:hypothetical protein n=1 Tax=Streptomyces sp. NPDC051014 TaxID=3155751 RepID=UPI0033DE0821